MDQSLALMHRQLCFGKIIFIVLVPGRAAPTRRRPATHRLSLPKTRDPRSGSCDDCSDVGNRPSQTSDSGSSGTPGNGNGIGKHIISNYLSVKKVISY